MTQILFVAHIETRDELEPEQLGDVGYLCRLALRDVFAHPATKIDGIAAIVATDQRQPREEQAE